jgi:gamma-glutamyl phosphate reductase
MFAELKEKGERARRAARRLATLDTTTKNNVLKSIAEALVDREREILNANAQDVENGREAGLGEALLERLLLNSQRLEGIANDVVAVVALPDPVGATYDARTLANGLRIGRRRVPVGVIGVIYESRPNVTVDISALCLKSGNAAILRGGKEAVHSNRALTEAIVHNSKVQRPTVCNALDTLLIQRDVARDLLPAIADDLVGVGVELRCEPRALELLAPHPAVRGAGPDDFDTEFLSLVLAVKVVDDLDEALDHIVAHGTQHSDAILTENYKHAMRFVDEIDSAAVYVNASTRFTDGGQFGLGAEVAVSTQRLHARGPMGLQELTTYKWVIFGDGQVRP